MSDEVTQFLEQVEKLRGQQIEEDEVRARELEQYLAAKRERQARREGESHKGRLFAETHAPLLHFSVSRWMLFVMACCRSSKLRLRGVQTAGWEKEKTRGLIKDANAS
jgi:hypothetical protein